MKKGKFFKNIIIFSIFIFLISLLPLIISAPTPSPNIPILNQINPEKFESLPDSFEKFRENSANLSKEELKKDYLKREWTKLLAEHEFFGPVLYYTNKIFSFFNPIWKLIFGVEFSWSWAFFLSFFIWGLLIYYLYIPSKAIFKSPLFGTIGSIVIASIVGVTGVIAEAVNLLSQVLTNLLWLTICVILIIIITTIYTTYMKKLEIDSEQEELARAKEDLKLFGKLSGWLFGKGAS